ncbi:MAG: hypothetical protein LBI28_11420 [Treponema sp.]|jgi:glycerophosphoryl diester phosphodiesterase|nr:hypothetical protein [Treponema sp.]
MEWDFGKIYLISIIVVIIAMIISGIFSSIERKWRINLLDKEEQKKLNDFNYDVLEINRVRDQNFTRGTFLVGTIPFFDEYVKVYGKKDKKYYLIYQGKWSKSEYDELKIIIDNYNNKKN